MEGRLERPAPHSYHFMQTNGVEGIGPAGRLSAAIAELVFSAQSSLPLKQGSRAMTARGWFLRSYHRFHRPLAFPDRSSERSKQGAVYRIGLRIVLGVPLDAQCEPGRLGNSDGLDRAVLRHALDDNAIPRFQNALTVERVDANRLSVEEPREDTAGNETDVMAICENDCRVRMEIPVFQPRRSMVHASGQLADFRMQGASEGNSHLLDTAAETKDGDALRNAGLRHLQRHFIPVLVVRFVARMGFGVEIDWMNVGAVARKQDAVDRVQQRPDIREVGPRPRISEPGHRRYPPQREGFSP